MSERISRLAELRRKRDLASSNSHEVAMQNSSESTNLPATSEPIASKKEKDESSDLPKSEEKFEKSNENIKAVIVGDANETLSKTPSSVGPSIEINGGETTALERGHAAYNRDLKNDISSLLSKAKLDTEMALNEIIWRSYRETQAD